jgi:hypothetical protein
VGLIDLLTGFSRFGFSRINLMHYVCVVMFLVDYFISIASIISFHLSYEGVSTT